MSPTNVITSTSPNFSNLLDEALARTLAAATQQVHDWNAVLKANYLTAFDNWSQSVIAGRADNTNPPQPPRGYVVSYFADPTTGPGSAGPYGDMVIKWAYPMLGLNPVCAMPALPAVPGVNLHPSGTAMIGVHVWDAFYQSIPGDTMPCDEPGGYSRVFHGVSSEGISGFWRKYNHGNLSVGYELMRAD